MNKKEIKNNNDKILLNSKDDKKTKKQFFKMFIDENKNPKKKLHLIKSNSQNFHFKWKNCENDKNVNYNKLNLQLFSYRIMEAKHNSIPEQYHRIVYNILIKKKKCHIFAYFNEISINTNTLKDNLKRYYKYQETKERIPKYVSYYQNYLLFFCKPFFTNFFINKLMVKYMEKVAQIFYNNNYADENEKDEKNKKEKKFNFEIFSKKISEEIENYDIYTIINSQLDIKINNNKIKNKDKDNYKRNNDLNYIDIEQSTINGNSNIITMTQRYSNEKRVIDEEKNGNKENDKENEKKNAINLQNDNSISLLINELKNRDKYKIKGIKNINIIPNENKNINKKNEIIKKSNDNYIVIQGGKTTNNINISINYLTIGQKLISPNNDSKKILSGITPINNKLNRKESFNSINSNKIISIIKKENTNNSFIKFKQISSKKINNYIESASEKYNIEKKKNKNSNLTLPPPTKNIVQNKKFIKIFPNTIKNSNNNNNYYHINNYIKRRDNPLKEARNRSVFRGGYNSSSMTNLHKYKNVNMSENNKLGKITIYTNNTNKNYIQSIINYGTSKIKNNINYNKNIVLLSGEREKRSSSNIYNKSKKVFSSIMKFNDGKIQYLKIKNDSNVISPMMNDIHKKQTLYNKIDNKDYKVKDLKFKKRNLNLNKFLNFAHKKIRAKSTGK